VQILVKTPGIHPATSDGFINLAHAICTLDDSTNALLALRFSCSGVHANDTEKRVGLEKRNITFIDETTVSSRMCGRGS
jgi:hypothetical protein